MQFCTQERECKVLLKPTQAFGRYHSLTHTHTNKYFFSLSRSKRISLASLAHPHPCTQLMGSSIGMRFRSLSLCDSHIASLILYSCIKMWNTSKTPCQYKYTRKHLWWKPSWNITIGCSKNILTMTLLYITVYWKK